MRNLSLKELEIDKELLIEKIGVAKQLSKKRKFKQSIEVIIAIKGLDLKRPENRMNFIITLPNELGKQKRVCVFADGPFAEEAKKQGADRILTRADIESLAGNKAKIKKMAKEYDFFIAQPELMGQVGKYFGFVLGPRGKMPIIIRDPAQLRDRINELRRSVRVQLRYNPEVACSIG
ncbi:50S ribosomal protein L1, partial [Candidatus Geothermarchaeota archaeon]